MRPCIVVESLSFWPVVINLYAELTPQIACPHATNVLVVLPGKFAKGLALHLAKEMSPLREAVIRTTVHNKSDAVFSLNDIVQCTPLRERVCHVFQSLGWRAVLVKSGLNAVDEPLADTVKKPLQLDLAATIADLVKQGTQQIVCLNVRKQRAALIRKRELVCGAPG